MFGCFPDREVFVEVSVQNGDNFASPRFAPYAGEQIYYQNYRAACGLVRHELKQLPDSE